MLYPLDISAEYSRMQFRSGKFRIRVLRAGGVNEWFETVLISCYTLCDKQRSNRLNIDNAISGDWGMRGRWNHQILPYFGLILGHSGKWSSDGGGSRAVPCFQTMNRHGKIFNITPYQNPSKKYKTEYNACSIQLEYSTVWDPRVSPLGMSGGTVTRRSISVDLCAWIQGQYIIKLKYISARSETRFWQWQYVAWTTNKMLPRVPGLLCQAPFEWVPPCLNNTCPPQTTRCGCRQGRRDGKSLPNLDKIDVREIYLANMNVSLCNDLEEE